MYMDIKIDLTIDESTHESIKDSFARIAEELMNKWIIMAGSNEYRIAELEFYYNSDSHPDWYSHKHELQKTREKWYFHPSGIDITCGNGTAYGGILIRAICNIKTDEYFYGPLKLLTELFNTIPNILSLENTFGLIHYKDGKLKHEVPIPAPRIGLNKMKDQIELNKDKNQKGYYDRPYRFLIMPEKEHREKFRYENK